MLKEFLEKDPNDAFLNYAYALELQKKGDTQAAIAALENLHATQPDYLGTYYQLGKLYEASAMIQSAIAIYSEGLSVARRQNNKKIMGELNEAILLLED